MAKDTSPPSAEALKKRRQRLKDREAGIAHATIRMPAGDVSLMRDVARRRLEGQRTMEEAVGDALRATNDPAPRSLFKRITKATPPIAHDVTNPDPNAEAALDETLGRAQASPKVR